MLELKKCSIQIDFVKAQETVRQICFYSGYTVPSLQHDQLLSYANDNWDLLSPTAANLLRQCVQLLRGQTSPHKTRSDITSILGLPEKEF